MKIRLDSIDSKIVKNNKTYTLLDNTKLNNLVVSKTILHPGQETTGHNHPGQEEVYQFTSGHGRMECYPEDISFDTFDVGPGDIVLIPDGDFHKVWNTTGYDIAGYGDLEFICVFDGGRNH